jgi:hypothetical protein
VKGIFESVSPDARGTFSWRVRSGGTRQILKIDARVRFGAVIDEATAGEAVAYAIFPDGTACELARDIRGSDVKYRLELRAENGTTREKRGTCAPSILPSFSGGPVDVELDDDDDPSTLNTKLLTGDF